MNYLDTNKRKVLFLQPESYYSNLGLDVSEIFTERKYGVFSLFFLTKRKYSVVISCIDHSAFLRAASLIARIKGAKSILIMDGVFDWANAIDNSYHKKLKVKLLNPVCYDCIITVDKELCVQLKRHGIEAYMYRTIKEREGQCVLKKSQVKTVLITTANTPYFDIEEKNNLCRLIDSLVAVLKRMGFYYKFRFYDRGLMEYYGLCGNSDENLIAGKFQEIAKEFDVVFSTPSTVVQTCMELDIPVAILDYRDTPFFTNAGWRIHGACSIEKTVLNMVGRDLDRMNFQRSLITEQSLNEAISKALIVSKRAYFDNEPVIALEHLSKAPFTVSLDYLFRVLLSRFKKNKWLNYFLKRIIKKKYK